MVLGGIGSPGYTVREVLQTRDTEQVLASQRLFSGTITSPIYDTRRFRGVMLWGDISQISGTGAIVQSVNYEGSVYGDNNWWTMSGAPRKLVGKWYERFPSGIYTFESSGLLNNFSRFTTFTNASSDGGIWSQVDAVFLK